MRARHATRGFTLMEVMIALALLGLALTVLIKSSAGSIFNAEQAHMMGVATDLARGKMYDIEERLLKEGFTDTDQSECRDFSDEGWPLVTWCSKVITVELPSWDDLQNMALGHMKAMGCGSGAGGITNGSGFGVGNAFGSASNGGFGGGVGSGCGSGSNFSAGSGSGAGSNGVGSDDPASSFQNSALGGMMGMLGGLGGGGGGGLSSGGGFGSGSKDADSQRGGAFVQQQFQMVQQVLKVSIRKVVLVVKWKVLGNDRDMTVVAFFTDPSQMDQVLNGLGSTDIGDGTGSGSGSGSGSNTSKTITPAPATGTK